MVSLLDRLTHSRVLARLDPRLDPRAPDCVSASGPSSLGYVHERSAWRLRPREAGRTARSFTEPASDRPRLLGGALDRLILPEAEPLARALASLGVAAGARASSGVARPVFLDGETTGLADSLAFVLGIAFVQADQLIVEQWTLERLPGEAAMLTHLFARLDELGPAPLISFNGASFDLPLLRRRALRHGLSAPALAGDHFDLLHAARRIWSDRAADCRLGTLEREQLDVVRRDDLPSHEIPAVFEAWLREPGDPIASQRLRAVVLHNQADLVTLPALVARLAERVEAPSDLAMAMNAAGLLIKHGRVDRARAMLERWIEPGEQASGDRQAWREAVICLAELERRAGARERAAACWRRIVEIDAGDPQACEALAKHHEHHRGAHAEALVFARRSRVPDLLRIARLERKLGRVSPPLVESPVVESPVVESPPVVRERIALPFAKPARPEPAPAKPEPAPAKPEPRVDPAWRSSVALRFAPWRRPAPSPLLVEREDPVHGDPKLTYRLFTR